MLLSLAAGAPGASATTYSSSVMGSTPTTYYRFLELTGTTAANEVTTGPAANSGWNGTDANKVDRGVGYQKDGVDGAGLYGYGDYAYGFTNSASVNAPDTAATAPTGDFALEVWVKPTELGTPRHIVSKYGHYSTTGGTNDEYDGYAVRTNADGTLAVYVNNGRILPLLTSVGKLKQHVWTHIVVSSDGASVRLYLNGQLDASAAVGGALTRSPNPLYIGAASGPAAHRGTNVWRGNIDDVSIYDHPLSAGEVATHFNNVVTYPRFAVGPVISGSAVRGGTLTVSNGIWSPAVPPTFTYEWRRSRSLSSACTAISGATSSTYVVQAADEAMRLEVEVTATNSVTSVNPTTPRTRPAGYASSVAADGAGSYSGSARPAGRPPSTSSAPPETARTARA